MNNCYIIPEQFTVQAHPDLFGGGGAIKRGTIIKVYSWHTLSKRAQNIIPVYSWHTLSKRAQNIIPVYTVDIHFQNAHKTHKKLLSKRAQNTQKTAMTRTLHVRLLRCWRYNT